MPIKKEKSVKKTIKRAIQKVKGAYNVLISANGVTQEFFTDSLKEAIEQFEVPAAIKTEVDIIVKKGDRKREELLGVMQARRIFGGSRVGKELLISKIDKYLTL